MGNVQTTHQATQPVITVPAHDQAVPAPHATVPSQQHQPPPPRQDTAAPTVKAFPDLRMRRLMGVSAWALALAVTGFVVGAIALIRLMGDMPGWFEPVFAATGVFGLLLIVAAFVTVQYRRIPWLLLGASSVTLVAGIIMLGNA
ncbi:hypothetical protein [Stackebrandtia albiflava]|nr:hypothetical protein [Stackebrandtia albiflava]